MRAIQVQIPAARRVLDFGCGTGWVIEEAQFEGRSLRFGIDLSFDALAQASQRRNISFAVSNGLELPFADGVFDVVVGHVSMPYMPTRAALCEVHRVLAPGGSFLFTFHSFSYWRQRLRTSLRTHRWKDVVFMGYVAANGLLNHWALAQQPVWWKRSAFETVNTQRGVIGAAQAAGFVMITTEHAARRIFFAVTARKPQAGNGAVLPAPGFAINCPLAHQL